MSNENNNPGLPQEENWLDEILGTETPKAEITPEELASIGEELTAEQLDLDRIMEESWDTDQQTITEIQDSVAQELPTIPLEDQPTSRVPFIDPTVSVAEPAREQTADSPTIAIPVIEQSPFFSAAEDLGPAKEPQEPAPAPVFMPATDFEGTQRFTPQEEPDILSFENPFTPQEPEIPQQEEPPVLPAEEPVSPKQVKKQPTPEAADKARPAPKKGYGLFGIPHIASTLIWLVIIVAVGVSLGRMLWVCCADLMAFGKPDKQVTITITAEDVKVLPDGSKEVDIDAISQKLGDAGLIEYPALFKFFATITNKDENLAPGTYTLNCYFDYNAMINAMSSYEKPRQIVTVLIPEGYNCAQLFALLETYEVCTVEELEQCAANGNEELGDYWFLTDEIPWGEKYCLEGYLFPDTYEFYTNDDPANVLNKMLSNFDNRFTDKMKTNLADIESRYGLTLHQVLTIASMVEEEAVGATKTTTEYEGYNIASVYYNRLANWEVPILGCDATVYYAMGDYFGAAGELTAAHLETDSPYNTRKYAGLPPGPITNPGSYSIYAALEPADTDYYYYVYDPEQKIHRLSTTEAEHEQIKAELGY